MLLLRYRWRYLSAVARREAPAAVRKDRGHHRSALFGAPLPFGEDKKFALPAFGLLERMKTAIARAASRRGDTRARAAKR
jgi:hypothetical protein